MSEKLTKTLRSALLDMGQRENALRALVRADPHKLRVIVEDKDDRLTLTERHWSDERLRARKWERIAAHLRWYDPPHVPPNGYSDVTKEVLNVLDDYYWADCREDGDLLLLAALVEYMQPVPRTTVIRHLRKLEEQGIAARTTDRYHRNAVVLLKNGTQRWKEANA